MARRNPKSFARRRWFSVALTLLLLVVAISVVALERFSTTDWDAEALAACPRLEAELYTLGGIERAREILRMPEQGQVKDGLWERPTDLYAAMEIRCPEVLEKGSRAVLSLDFGYSTIGRQAYDLTTTWEVTEQRTDYCAGTFLFRRTSGVKDTQILVTFWSRADELADVGWLDVAPPAEVGPTSSPVRWKVHYNGDGAFEFCRASHDSTRTTYVPSPQDPFEWYSPFG